MTGRPYVTGSRLDAVASTLVDTDRDLLLTLQKVRVATGKQLQALHHGDDDAAKQRRVRQLARLSRAGLVTRLGRRVGGPGGGSYSGIYALDLAGVRLLDPERAYPRRPWTSSSHHLAHALFVTQVYVDMRRATSDGIDLLQFDTEPTCWRRFTVSGALTVLKPDGHVVVGRGDEELHWFVEADLASEGTRQIVDKARTYAQYWATGQEDDAHGVFPQVLWVSATPGRLTQLRSALRRLNPRDRVLFVLADVADAVAVLTGEEGGVRP
jgi:hypothetical protein